MPSRTTFQKLQASRDKTLGFIVLATAGPLFYVFLLMLIPYASYGIEIVSYIALVALLWCPLFVVLTFRQIRKTRELERKLHRE